MFLDRIASLLKLVEDLVRVLECEVDVCDANPGGIDPSHAFFELLCGRKLSQLAFNIISNAVFKFPRVGEERVVLPWDIDISGLVAVAGFQRDLDCVVGSGACLQVPLTIFYPDKLLGILVQREKSENRKDCDC